MTVHAFIDESRRGHTYLMAVVLVDPAHLAPLRRQMRQLLLRGERELHFKKEKDPRRKHLAANFSTLAAEALVYTCTCDRQEEPARQACVTALTVDLVKSGARRMVLDSREVRNQHDRTTIKHTLAGLGYTPAITYEHMEGPSEPLLWLADGVAWCWGAKGQWRKAISPLITGVTELTT